MSSRDIRGMAVSQVALLQRFGVERKVALWL